MTPRPQPPHRLQAPTQLGAQGGIVLLTVLVMLVVASAWATYAWRQVFWQQRMLHSQGLEQMAWHAAEAGALALQYRVAQQLSLNPSLNLAAALPAIQTMHNLPGTPAGHWQIRETRSIASKQRYAQAIHITISGHISDAQHSAHHIAQAQLLVDMEATPTGLHITRWQRVYPR
jgi:hypothetical protein